MKISESTSAIIFEKDKDPGKGYLRIVGNLAKIEKICSDHTRGISLQEIYEVMFLGGRSTLLKENDVSKKFNGKEIQEKQFRIIGLTLSGKPIIVVFTPRDDHGLAKRIITAWRTSKKSKEVKKLLKDCPLLREEVCDHKT